jgi:hypothetical protein
MNQKNLLLIAILGLGAYYVLIRKAVAAGVGKQSQPPNAWSQAPTRANAPTVVTAAPGTQSTAAAAINFMGQLLSGQTAPLYRTPDFNPGYYPDNAGEAAAAAVTRAMPDLFAVNRPDSYSADPSAYASTGGWLDNQ